jgi:hypothetical protein
MAAFLAVVASGSPVWADPPKPIVLDWNNDTLTLSRADLPGGSVEIWYLEAYCRPGSTDRDWRETVIGHKTRLESKSPDGTELVLSCRLNDGVEVSHRITSSSDSVAFEVVATNPTDRPSLAHWAQPCMRVDKFTGCPRERDGQNQYLANSFIFVDGQLARLPTEPWATNARYTPGQVWRPAFVPASDVNPRPLSTIIPSNGLIGCFSADEKAILAMAWEPYQELFQGVIVCLHSDFRIGGLDPGQTRKIKGRVYIVPHDVPALLKRYEADFPEHTRPDR